MAAGVPVEGDGDSAAEPVAVGLGWRAPSQPSPRYSGPDEIEVQLGQFFAQQTGLAVGSLSSIVCGATYCEIALTGRQVDPRYVDEYQGVYSKLSATRRNDFRILSSSIGTREIAPGARENVIGFEYQPFVDATAASALKLGGRGGFRATTRRDRGLRPRSLVLGRGAA